METSHLVLLPGLDGTGLSFAPIVALLPPDVRASVVTYPKIKMSFEETLECAARQFPQDGSLIVLAESFSGPVAIELVASGRVNATGLVLAATFAKSPRPILSLLSGFLPLEILLQAKPPQAVEDYILGKEYVARLKPMWEKIREKVPAAILLIGSD